MSAPEAAQMSEGQREEAWLKRVTEQQMRRMRAGAGYNPDVTTGTAVRADVRKRLVSCHSSHPQKAGSTWQVLPVSFRTLPAAGD